MNQREAKRQVTDWLARVTRGCAENALMDHDHTPADRLRLHRAFTELADEMAARYHPELRRPPSEPAALADPDQIPLFEEQQ